MNFLIYIVINNCVNKNDCSNHGNCVNSQCSCDQGYTGDTCSDANCVNGYYNKFGECKCKFGSTLKNGVCTKSCGSHGNYSIKDDDCICADNWKTAGITDTIAYLEGKCSQFGNRRDETYKQKEDSQ